MNGNLRKPAATAKTVTVIVAAAQARADLAAIARLYDRRYEFRLLAAADQEIPTPPAAGWHDLRRLLRAEVNERDGELRLSLQAEGYAALHRVAGQAARLNSQDGALDVRLRFDKAGHAIAVLAGTMAVRRALRHFRLTLDDSSDPG